MKRLLTLIFLASFCFGQYTFTTIEELELDEPLIMHYNIVAMNDSIIVLAYRGGDHDLIMKSYECDADGSNLTMLDSFNVTINYIDPLEMIKIDEDLVLLAYGYAPNNFLETIAFDINWDMSSVDKKTSTNVQLGQYELVNVLNSPTTNAVLFSGKTSGGIISTITWDEGTGDNIVQGGFFDWFSSGKWVKQVKAVGVNDSIYISIHYGDSGDPTVTSHNTGADWEDIRAEIDILVTHNSGSWQEVERIDNTHVLVWFSDGTERQSFLETISFDIHTGANLASVNTHQQANTDADAEGNPMLLRHLDTDDYILWRDWGGTYNVRSYNVDGSYVITDNGDSTDFSATDPEIGNYGGVNASLVNAETGLYALIYSTITTQVGYLQTMLVEDAGGWAHKILGIETPTAVNSATEFTKVSGVE